MPLYISAPSKLPLLVFALLLALASPAPADEPSGNTITATGHASLEIPAERMLLAVDLIARHQSVDEAVKLLEDRIEAARTQVTALGAIAETITVGDPQVSNTQTDAQQLQLRAQILEGLQRAGRSADEIELGTTVTVTARITAEWQLSADNAVEGLAQVHTLQQQIREAKLSGADDVAGLSAQEQELLEEAQMLAMTDYYTNEQTPGEPVFLFYADVSPDDHAAALKQAFEAAKAQASRLAQAAGVHLGELQSLQEAAPGSSMQHYTAALAWAGTDYASHQLADQLLKRTADAPAAHGKEYGTLTYSVQLTAAFRFAK